MDTDNQQYVCCYELIADLRVCPMKALTDSFWHGDTDFTSLILAASLLQNTSADKQYRQGERYFQHSL